MTTVTPEQENILKEKGFHKEYPHIKNKNYFYYNGDFNIRNNCEEKNDFAEVATKTEQQKVVDWLCAKYDIYIDNHVYRKKKFYTQVIIPKKATHDWSGVYYGLYHREYFNSPEESYSAAFNYTLNNLI